MAKRLEYNATLTHREDLTEDLAIFSVRLDEALSPKQEGGPRFIPGQYLTIGLNREDEDTTNELPVSVLRPMSIASAPEEEPEVQFYIRWVAKPESSLPLTHLLWKLKANDRMYVRPAATGRFTIEDTLGADYPGKILLLSAGTGLAPFISMVRSPVRRNLQADLSRYAIIHGVSRPEFLGYKAELEILHEQNKLAYMPTISRPQEAPDWKGAVGRAEAQLSLKRLEQTEQKLGLQFHPEQTGVLICGLTGTIRETIISLLSRGYVPHHRRLRRALSVPEEVPSSIYWEQYDSDPIIDVKNEELLAELRRTLQAAQSW